MIKSEILNFIEQYNSFCQIVAGNQPFRKLHTRLEANINSATFIDFKDGTYQYGGYERGSCFLTFESTDMNECMFYPVNDALFSLAFDFELKNRIENQDSRIIAFKTWVDYMKQINLEWAKKVEFDW